MRKQGQGGIIGYFFLLAVFVAIWALWLGGFLAEQGALQIQSSGLVGIEAFIVGNYNLWVLLGVIAAAAGGVYFSGGGQ